MARRTQSDILFRYLADTKSLEKGNKRARKSLGGLSDTAKGLARTFAGAFAAREVVQFARASIDAASDYEESVNAVQVAAGSAAREILKLGDNSAEAFGLSRTAVNEAAVAFTAFGEKISPSDVGGKFEEFLGRAVDFASVMNLDVQDALAKFQSGLAGETEPLRRFGIDVSAAATASFAYANGIAEAGAKLTETQKIQARYGLILQQTNKFQGDFERTADSTANTQKILTAEIEDFRIELGQSLQPVYRDLLKVSIALLPVLEKQVGNVDDLVEAYKAWSSILSEIADKNFDGVLNDAEGAARGLGEVAERLFPPLKAADWIVGKVTGNTIGFKDALEAVNPLIDTATVVAGQYGDSADDAAKKVSSLKKAQDGLNEAVNVFDPKAAIQAMRDFISLRNILGSGSLPRGGGIAGPVPGFAEGGVVPGPRGSPQLAVVHGGEEVLTPAQRMAPRQTAAPVVVNVEFSGVVGDPVAVAQEIRDLLDLDARTGGF